VSGRDELAEEDLNAIARNDSSEVEAYLGLAEIYRRRGEIGRAITLYQNLNLRSDLDAEQREAVLCGLGLAFESGGFVPRAVATFEQVLERSSDQRTALEALMRLLPMQGDLERALVVRRRWGRKHGSPDQEAEAALLAKIAQTRLDEGRDAMAERAARRALRLDGAQIEAHLVLAEVAAHARRPKRVVEHLLGALEQAPEHVPEILLRLEAAWPEGAGRRGSWIEELRALARKHADDPAYVEALARALVEAGETAPGLEVLEAGLVRWPADLGLRARMGRILLSTGQYDEALTAYADLLDQLEKRAEDDA
jgi:lipopolysaccharide biosynthesis regulator YciM